MPLEITQTPPSAPTGMKFSSSKLSLGPDTMIAWLIWAPSGFGKTKLTGQLDALTQKYLGKRTLYIPLEASDGGGIATIRSLDVPIFVPDSYADIDRLLSGLRNDKTIGGVVIDSATELSKAWIKPAAMKYACRENVDTRKEGVPCRSDYQVMGEMLSGMLRRLLLLTKHPDPAYRKHVIITAADHTRFDADDQDKIIWQGPDLPGRMGREAVQMFQQVGSLSIKPIVTDGKRRAARLLSFKEDGILARKDRYDIFPEAMEIQKDPGTPGESISSIYEKYWLPQIVR